MFRKIREYYLNLRLKYKMVILTSLVLLAFSIGGLSILQYAFNLYNKEIYRQSAQALQVSTNSVEAELKKMERLSYQISTDSYVQSYLQELSSTDSSYDKFMIGNELRKRLLHIGALNKYVQSIQVYDVFDKEYASGNFMLNMSKERLQTMKEVAREEEGGVNWVSPSGNDQTVMAVRDIREYLEFSFDRLGTVGVRVDIHEIMNELTNNLEEQETDFLIFDKNDNTVFANEHRIDSINPSEYMNKNEQGYQIIKYKGERYFLTYSEANHLDWTYMILTPYSNLFTVITKARTAVFLTYFGLFLLMIFLGTKFTGTIINPIESLNKKMKKVQTGDLDYYDVGMETELTRDEAGQMHENFKKMMNQINYLIGENYKKQLLIKESEFKTLQAQVNPHFLYNTLESINWSAKIVGEKKISQMAESLGYVLRASINMKDTLISLEEELSIAEHYITIQSYRFEERLEFSKDIPDSYLSEQVPKFIIQPLVENAIRYGLQEMIGVCKIQLSVMEEKGFFIIHVEDNGPGMQKAFLEQIETGEYQPKGTGIGLRNINERIKLLFGEEYGLKVDSVIGKGTKVSIMLPKEEKQAYVQSIVSR
ncbi:cache domain-containing sensor histidine kinase [Gracilibacillus kekensis]|uniref:histidine kinase n=1 Tax=Gracilibacillus kekensis TaxID=1027249 RepID=A0A1M7MTB9_9BACI|nr:sensor histidine kinase [Gracilibacillus kekensis]SHM94260.1 two-component system, sensor histidine kinase YesM [Gracilibacillus kekensis]